MLYIFSLSMEMSRLARDGTAEPVSRDQILRHARRQRNINFPCSADHEQDWQPYPVDPYSAICDDHTYILCAEVTVVKRIHCILRTRHLGGRLLLYTVTVYFVHTILVCYTVVWVVRKGSKVYMRWRVLLNIPVVHVYIDLYALLTINFEHRVLRIKPRCASGCTEFAS